MPLILMQQMATSLSLETILARLLRSMVMSLSPMTVSLKNGRLKSATNILTPPPTLTEAAHRTPSVTQKTQRLLLQIIM